MRWRTPGQAAPWLLPASCSKGRWLRHLPGRVGIEGGRIPAGALLGLGTLRLEAARPSRRGARIDAMVPASRELVKPPVARAASNSLPGTPVPWFDRPGDALEGMGAAGEFGSAIRVAAFGQLTQQRFGFATKAIQNLR